MSENIAYPGRRSNTPGQTNAEAQREVASAIQGLTVFPTIEHVRRQVRSVILEEGKARSEVDYGPVDFVADLCRELSRSGVDLGAVADDHGDHHLLIDGIVLALGLPSDPWPGLTEVAIKDYVGTKRLRLRLATNVGLRIPHGRACNEIVDQHQKWIAAQHRAWLEAGSIYVGTPDDARREFGPPRIRIRVPATAIRDASDG